MLEGGIIGEIGIGVGVGEEGWCAAAAHRKLGTYFRSVLISFINLSNKNFPFLKP